MSSPLPPLAELAPGLSAAGKLDRDDLEALAAAGVRTIINNRPDGEDPGQLPAGEGVPKLIEVARTHRNPEVRRQAMFWLGQSKDSRATKFFEDVLLKK